MVRGCEGATVRRCLGARVRDRRTRSTGFTLIELLIVMVLLILLAGITLATYGNSVRRGKEAALAEDLFQMRKAIDEYYADKGKYPTDLQTLVTEKYLRAIAPDPFTNSAETWQEIASEPDAANPSAEPGISNVKSGSDQTGLNGKPYSEWE
jgi:general secretion pathway protein G